MNIQKLLQQLGLSGKESLLYQTGLRIGPSRASALSSTSGIGRVQTYHALDALQQKGLVSMSGPDRKTIFAMEPPHRLLDILKRQQQELANLEESVAQAVTELESQQPSDAGQQIKVRFYEGVDGLKHVAQDIIEDIKNPEMQSLAPLQNVMDTVDAVFLKQWFAQLNTKNVTSKSIWSNENRDPAFAREGRDLRLTPEDMSFPATVMIYDDTVCFFTAPPQVRTIVIENPDVAATMRALHEQTWKNSRVL